MVTTRIIPKRYYYIGFDYGSIDDIINTCKTIHADGIMGLEKDFDSRGVNDLKIKQIQSQGIQVILLWQPTNSNNLDVFYDISIPAMGLQKHNELRNLILKFPSLNGLHLEEPTIQLSSVRPFSVYAPIFTTWLREIRNNILSPNMHFSFNTGALNPNGDVQTVAGLDIKTHDTIQLWDWIQPQTGGVLLPAGFDSVVSDYESVVPNTLIIPVVYGWDSCGVFGNCTKYRTGCIDGYHQKECYNMNILDVIYNMSVTNPHNICITQMTWNIPSDWINNSLNYPCSGQWNLLCAIGNIPLPDINVPPLNMGILNISSSPSHADIWINGSNDNTGYTPMNLSLPAGTYSIKLVLPGYNNVTDTITISSGQNLIKSYPMTPVTVPPPPCVPVWQCEQPLNGYQSDGCGNRQVNVSCDAPKPKTQFLILAGIGIGLMAMLKKK